MADNFIDIEIAIDELCENCFMNNCSHDCDVIKILRKIPAADVQPIVHGKWIGEDHSYWRNYHSGARPVTKIRYKCSVCGRTENQKEPFCNCGAYMLEDNDDKR